MSSTTMNSWRDAFFVPEMIIPLNTPSCFLIPGKSYIRILSLIQFELARRIITFYNEIKQDDDLW